MKNYKIYWENMKLLKMIILGIFILIVVIKEVFS